MRVKIGYKNPEHGTSSYVWAHLLTDGKAHINTRQFSGLVNRLCKCHDCYCVDFWETDSEYEVIVDVKTRI